MDHGGYRYQLVLTKCFKKGGVDNQFKTECSTKIQKTRLRTEQYVPYPRMTLLDEKNNCHTPNGYSYFGGYYCQLKLIPIIGVGRC